MAVARRVAGALNRLSLAQQFLFASLVVVVAGGLVIGAWAGQQVEREVLNRLAASTGLLVDAMFANDLQPLATRSSLDQSTITTLDRDFATTTAGQKIVAIKVWSPDGVVVYSPNRALIGRQFPPDDELQEALHGKLNAGVTDLTDPENVYERQRWHRLLQVYAPVRDADSGRIMAVTEFYQLPDQLDHDVRSEKIRAWLVVGGVMLGVYALLAGIVKRGSDTIRSQEDSLRQKVSALSALLTENTRLHDRVRQAAANTTELNEQALRRISADLHDGPGQTLGLALLRLDALQERAAGGCLACGDGNDFDTVQSALRDAVAEVRAIAAGLRLPQLEPLSVAEVVERVVRDHERRSRTRIRLELGDLPARASLPIKIALFRSLQETLSNASRHGHGVDVMVRVWQEHATLKLQVSDGGPGFVPEAVPADGHLGLAGMRERAELLGGSFTVASAPGTGAVVNMTLPLDQEDHT